MLRAAASGDAATVAMLLSQGADPTIPDRRSFETALYFAAGSRDGALAKLLLAAGRRWRPGMARLRLDLRDLDTVRNADLHRLDYLLRSGLDPNSLIWPDQASLSLLSVAVNLQDMRFACMLLQHGADVSGLIDVAGWEMPVLHGAVHSRMQDLVWLLLVDGADVNRIEQKHSPLYFCVRHETPAILEMLLEAGADVESGLGSETPLMLAAGHGHLANVDLLLARHANVKARSASARTALHEAAEAGELQIVRRLLDAGADPLARDEYGRTATDCATEKYDPIFAQPMRDWGIPDRYSLEPVVDNWEPCEDFDFFISYRHGKFARQARELATALRTERCHPFLDQEMLELPDEAPAALVKSRLVKALHRCHTLVFFESYLDVGATGFFNWQFFELLYAREALFINLDAGVARKWIITPGKRIGMSDAVFLFDSIEQLAKALAARRTGLPFLALATGSAGFPES